MSTTPPPLLRHAASDEYAPLPWSERDRRAVERLARELPERARIVGMATDEYRFDRRGTAATLRAIDAEHGGGFFTVPEEATLDVTAAERAFAGRAAVVDVQTHLVDPQRWTGSHAAALAGFLQMVDPQRWPNGVDPDAIDAGAWAGLVFGASETAVALLTSTPGPAESNVLTNAQIASARDVVERYAGSGRVLTHAIVHPNLGESELDAMEGWRDDLPAVGMEVLHAVGPADEGRADRRLVPRRPRGGFPVPRAGACARTARRRGAQRSGWADS